MKKNIVNTDFDLLLECCKELDITLVPAQSSEHIIMTDAHGNEQRINSSFNIFECFDDSVFLETEYDAKENLYARIIELDKETLFDKHIVYKIEETKKYDEQENIYTQSIEPAA